MSTQQSEIGVYSIKAVSKMTAIPATTLRSWERTFALVVPERTVGGHRLYSAADVERLKWLKARMDEGLHAGAAHRLLERQLQGMDQLRGPGGGAGGLPHEAEQRSGAMILVAERDPITADLEEYFLRREGYEVSVVLDGKRVLEEAESNLPDLIIVALMLPSLSGLTVCQRLKAHPKTSDIPVLILSVLDLRERAMAAGADAFLLKPLDQAALADSVKRLLTRGSHRSERAAAR